MSTLPVARAVLLLFALTSLGACLGTRDSSPVLESPPAGQASPSGSELQDTLLDPGFVPASATSRNGPSTIVRQILQTASGDLWLATFGGLIRFDSESFTNLTTESGLQPTRAFSLLRDQADHIWVGTLGAGVYRYDGQTFENLTSRDGLAGDRVLSIMEDENGAIWFGFEGAGASRLDGHTATSFGAAEGFTDGDVSSLAEDLDGRIWLGTRDGLFRYDGASFENFSELHGLKTGGYVPVLVDRSGLVWFGGIDGLHVTDGESLHQVTKDQSWSLLEEDSDGNIWFTGDGSLNKIEAITGFGQAVPEPTRVATFEGLCFDIFEDRDGEIWIGTLRGPGRLDGDAIRYYASAPEM